MSMYCGTDRNLNRRAALRLLASSATLALLTACGAQVPAASNPPPATAAPVTPPATTVASVAAVATPAGAGLLPKRGGTLRAGLVGDIGLINPHMIGPQPLQTIFSIWDRLIAYDATTGTPQPMLAESWDLSADRLQLRFQLRKNVQFHSGRELTSEDVKWNLLRVRNPAANANQFNKQSQWFTTIDTSDKYAVVLTLDRPRPSILDFFELFNIGDQATLDVQTSQPEWVGTGPFKLADYQVGDHIWFARNENYWRTGRPYLDEFKVTILRDGAAAAVQLEAGALDLVFDPPAQDVSRLSTDPRFGVYVNDKSGISGIMNMNTTIPPTNNKLFRQAVHHAIDRQRYVDTVLRKRGEARSLPWTATSPAFDALKNRYFSHDLDKARSLLQASGVRKYERRLGRAEPGVDESNGAYMAGFTGAHKGREPVPTVDHDVHSRITDMDFEGVDVNLLLPSGWFGTFTTVPDVTLELAAFRAYNRWMADYCGAYPDRLGGVILLSGRDIEGGLQELNRCAKEPWAWGIFVYAPYGKPLDHPDFEPYWAAAEKHDLSVVLHTFTVMPPYAPGGLDTWDNLWLQRSAAHPWCGMRNMASVTSEYVQSGRYFQSIEMSEGPALTQMVAEQLGEGILMYASDYPHGESWFPKSVETVMGWNIPADLKQKLFWDNPLRFYRRYAGVTAAAASA